MKNKLLRPFRSVIYKTKLRPIRLFKYNYLLIATKAKLINRSTIETARIVISRQFQKKKKFSKHKRFQYIMKISKKRRNKFKFKPFLIKYTLLPIKLSYKYKLLPFNVRKINKKRMHFKSLFIIPITKKGSKSRMGKGKGNVSHYMCKIYINTILYNLYKVSKFRANTTLHKLKMKLGQLKPKFIRNK
jgi:ribosomal protein L16/L10AE